MRDDEEDLLFQNYTFGNSTVVYSLDNPDLYESFSFFSISRINVGGNPVIEMSPKKSDIGEYFTRIDAVEAFTYEHYNVTGEHHFTISANSASDADIGEEFSNEAAKLVTEETFETIFGCKIVDFSSDG